MWMNITIIREEPDRSEEIVEAANTKAFRNLLLNAAGFRVHYSVTNAENPGEGYSISVWNSIEEGQAFFSSPEYAQLMASLRHLLTNTPQRLHFMVNWEILHPELLGVA